MISTTAPPAKYRRVIDNCNSIGIGELLPTIWRTLATYGVNCRTTSAKSSFDSLYLFRNSCSVNPSLRLIQSIRVLDFLIRTSVNFLDLADVFTTFFTTCRAILFRFNHPMFVEISGQRNRLQESEITPQTVKQSKNHEIIGFICDTPGV